MGTRKISFIKVKTFIEDLAAPDWSFIESLDLVCISTVTSTAIKAYRMGKTIEGPEYPSDYGRGTSYFFPR